MATLNLSGKISTVRLTPDPKEGGTVARCVLHRSGSGFGECDWTETYDTLDDAAAYSAAHADTGRR